MAGALAEGLPARVPARLPLLFVLGAVALLSLLLVPVEAMVPEAARIPGLRLLALIQPAVLLLVAIFVGHRLAPVVGLGAPLIDALAGGRPMPVPAASVRDGLLVAAVVAGLLLGAEMLVAGMPAAAPLLAFEVPLVTRFFWGGIGEELLMRWGVMTALAWGLWRLSGRPAGPSAARLWVAIGLAALLFALGHLPVLMLLVPQPPAGLVALVLAGNLLPGLLLGWLYARRGIETAMLAHGGAHLLAAAAGLVA